MAEPQFKIFYWCQDTILFPYETGIQRVVRRLAESLLEDGIAVIPVGWDQVTRQVLTLSGSDRGRIPLDEVATNQSILFVPEIPIGVICGAGLDPIQLGRAYGLRTAAIVHDLIPIKRAFDYQPEVVSLYRRYYQQFAYADLVLATTNSVAFDLAAHLESEHLRVPPIEVTFLPAALPSIRRRDTLPPLRGAKETLKLLCVATWEPRKNILGLLHAFGQTLGDTQISLSLDLVGRRGAFLAYDEEVFEVARRLPAVTLRGPVSDAELVGLYESCHASVYPSVEEGFGMPIGESLWLGRPCLCHNASSMAEIAPGGGTVLVDMTDECTIANVLRLWATKPDEVTRLAREATMRPLRDWPSFAADVVRRLRGL